MIDQRVTITCMKTQSRRKKIKYFKHANKMTKNEIFFSKTVKSFWMIIKKFRRRWYPLNNAEIEMINQLFEGYHEVNINEKISIENVDYIINKSTKFKFKYTLSVDDWAYNITIRYVGKNEAIVGFSSVLGFLMGYGRITSFWKEKNRWVKKDTAYWRS